MSSEFITIEEARQMVEDGRNERALLCLAEVMRLVERHHCRIEAVSYITVEGRTLARFQVVAV